MNAHNTAKSLVFLSALLLLTAGPAFGAATVTIVNGNAPGVGFNDPTPATPVGGNAGTTLGQQRLNAFQFAADIWGATLDSNVEIQILATFEPLSCNATSAVLGSAGTRFVWSNSQACRRFRERSFPTPGTTRRSPTSGRECSSTPTRITRTSARGSTSTWATRGV